ncbi:MAG: MBL fold metallo-hydrolase [Deltaproteobacteria bacterium]|nr:MBL fold metallo-hydrolase [Deltaproteobacteria bacterium]
MPFITTPQRICKHIYLVDTNQFTQNSLTSAFIYWDGSTCLLMDVGTSNDADTLLANLKQHQISPDKVLGIVLTHYHFDHGGGASTLWKKITAQNPDFKIIVPADTHAKLQNPESHLMGAKTTFADKVGKMPTLPEGAFTIVDKDIRLPIELADGYQLQLTSVPGHSDDHCAPTLFQDGKTAFCFSGESCGTVFKAAKPRSMPTSMPPAFNFETYIQSCRKVAALSPEVLGFSHFGAITGKAEVAEYLDRHQQDMHQFRDTVIEAYQENPDTRHVVQQVVKMFKKQGNISRYAEVSGLHNVIFAFTFGMMIDLGYREAKYEQR